jgi:hypothetical protein
MKHIPNPRELELIQNIATRSKTEFAIVRLTDTMMKKSIIDAHGYLRKILREENIVNYDTLSQGPKYKIVKEAVLLSQSETAVKASFYRPLTKKGDPRFWVYNLNKFMSSGQLMFITVFESNIVIIPLIESLFSSNFILDYFKSTEIDPHFESLVNRLKEVIYDNVIESISPYKSNPKDVGETLENALGIAANSSKNADWNDEIEIKSKRNGKSNKSTLFSMVPDWDISAIPSSKDMILTYGYPSNKYPEFMDLFVTVSNKTNNQGLSLYVDEDNERVVQLYSDGKKVIETCFWPFEDLRKRLLQKHPKTIWASATEIITADKIHFKYERVEYTEKPIFSQFLLLIENGLITYDWRGRVKSDGKGYKDKGHCFRISPKNRHLLFGETKIIWPEE